MRTERYLFLKTTWFRILLHTGFWVFYLSLPIVQYMTYTDFSNNLLFIITVVNVVYVAFYYPFTYFILPRFFTPNKLFIFIPATILLYIAFFYSYHAIVSMLGDLLNLNESDQAFINEVYKRPVYYLPEFIQMTIVTAIPLSLKFVRRFYKLQDEKNDLAKLNTELELNFLKSQINPHFLFNTLNNIYSLSLQKSEKTPEMIIKLSDLMRYILYECDVEKVDLEKEVSFMKDYVELEKLRHGKHVQINFEVEGELSDKKTPPLLLIHFVENAFKHGVNAQIGQSFVKIKLDVDGKQMHFTIENNKPLNGENIKSFAGGIGLENIKKRLQLIYPNQHHLAINNESNLFKVELTVNAL